MAAVGLLFAATTSCALRTRLPEDAPPTRTASVPALPLESHADAEVPVAEPPPRIRRGDVLIGSPVKDSGGATCGAVEDVLIDPSTGAVIGVAATILRSEGVQETVVLEYGTVAWAGDSPQSAELVLPWAPADPVGHGNYTDLFDGRTLSSVAGEVTAVEARFDTARSAIVLKVHGQGNLLHRVLVEPAHLVASCFAPLEVGRSLEAEGVLTRDASGKLLVASAIVQDGERLELRDLSGTILWDGLTRQLASTRALGERPLASADGGPIPITGWLLDWADGVAAYLCVEVEGVERALPWDELLVDPESGAWTVGRSEASLPDLPAVSADGQVAVGL